MASQQHIIELQNTYPFLYDFCQPVWSHQYFNQFPSFFFANTYNTNFLSHEIQKDNLPTFQQQIQYFSPIQAFENRQSNQRPEKSQKTKKKKRTDTNYLNKYQKQDRNLNSIVLRNFVNFVNSHPRIKDFVQSIIQAKKLSMTAQQYLEQFKYNLPSKQSYVGVSKMKSFIDMENQNNGIKIITLILLRKFINTDFFTVLINSKKVTKSAREKELKHGKKFWKIFVKQILRI